MSTWVNAQGYATAAATGEVARDLDRAVVEYLGARLDTRDRLRAVLSSDPDCVMGHCLDGYLYMLSSKRETIPQARAAWQRAAAAGRRLHVTTREELHLGALEAWSQGDTRGAVDRWDAVLADYPRDILAVKVSQYVLSYLGESRRMRDTVARVLPAWDDGVPGYAFLLGCYAYGLEEAGDYALAEEMGRRAVEFNPEDIWAAHAVAHVMGMQGRLTDGLDWIGLVSHHWRRCSNFALHLRWHEALFHLDCEQYDRVLELYDREVRPHPTDEYLDITNAVSLLWRLEQAGVDVGERWRELAACATGHVGDHVLVFADLHYLMALAANRDADTIGDFLESCHRFAAAGRGTGAAVMAEVGLPLAQAILAHRRGDHGDVVDALVPLRARFRSIGGSHAQRDLFDRLVIDSAWRARRLDVAAELLAHRVANQPRNLWAWKHYAAVLDEQGAPAAAHARRELERIRAQSCHESRHPQ